VNGQGRGAMQPVGTQLLHRFFRWPADRAIDVIHNHVPGGCAKHFLRLKNGQFEGFTDIVEKEHLRQALGGEIKSRRFLMLDTELPEGVHASQIDDHCSQPFY